MQKVHQVQDTLSLYNVFAQIRVGQVVKVKHGLFIALISAFFVVCFALAALQVSHNFSVFGSGYANPEEKVAYEPGMFVSQDISMGYLGK